MSKYQNQVKFQTLIVRFGRLRAAQSTKSELYKNSIPRNKKGEGEREVPLPPHTRTIMIIGIIKASLSQQNTKKPSAPNHPSSFFYFFFLSSFFFICLSPLFSPPISCLHIQNSHSPFPSFLLFHLSTPKKKALIASAYITEKERQSPSFSVITHLPPPCLD